MRRTVLRARVIRTQVEFIPYAYYSIRCSVETKFMKLKTKSFASVLTLDIAA
jgi:hypothetical protein